jgi:hypothetical protein
MRSAAVLVVLVVLALASFPSPTRAAEPGPPADQPAAKEPGRCKKLPAGKPVLKLNLKPESEVSDLVSWMSTITCKTFLFTPADLQGKKVTVLSPRLMTVEEAYRLFVDTLSSVGLKVEPVSGRGRDGEVVRIFPRPAR